MRILHKRRIETSLLCALVVLMLVMAPIFEANATAYSLANTNIGVDISHSQNGYSTVTAEGTGMNVSTNGAAALTNSFKVTTTITIKNNYTTDAALTFNYTGSTSSGNESSDQISSITIDGTDVAISSGTSTCSGSVDKTLEAGSTFTITLVAGKGKRWGGVAGNAKLDISNIALTPPSSLGLTCFPAEIDYQISYYENMDADAAVSLTVNKDATEPANLTAMKSRAIVITSSAADYYVAGANYTDASGNSGFLLATNGRIYPEDGYTITPVLVYDSDGIAPFLVSGAGYWNLEAAVAATNGAGTIVLNQDYTLPEGNYTIPSGVTLLIPFDAANTLYTDAPACTVDTYTKPTTYRTLALAEGANITINGAMSVSAKHSSKQGYTGAPSDSVGMVNMASGSKITVADGGKLYAWGYIIGSGSVEALPGSAVYENFQIADWRGGTAISSMNNNSNKVFPISQYYVQNIEVPLTMHAGATETGYMSVAYGGLSGTSTASAPVPFFGDSGLFRQTSGTMTKDYDEATDRLVLTMDGNGSISSLTISVQVSILGSVDLDSSKYVLPISSNLTVNITSESAASIDCDMAFLPGAQINIASGATATLGSGVNVYCYDSSEWGSYVYNNGAQFLPVVYAPGKTYTRTNADLVDAALCVDGTLDASAGYLYTTSSGANIYTNGTGVVKMNAGTATVTYQATQSGTDVSYSEISITSAQLKNPNGVYVSTVTGTYNACTTHGWFKGETCPNCHEHTYDAGVVTTPATCTEKGVMTYSCTVSGCTNSYTEEIAALGHNMVAGEVTAPTCTAGGYTTYTCENGCGTTEQRDQTSATGHTEVIDAAVAPTCTATGKTEGKHCSVCDEVLVAQTVVNALGHTEVIDAAVAPTCTKTGLTEGKHCSVCKKVLVAQEEIPALGHDMQETTAAVDPGCETTGKTAVLTCANGCGKTEGGDEIPANGHSYSSVVTAPSCVEQGYTTHTCGNCGDSYVDSYVGATGHSWVPHTGTPESCTENGSYTNICSVCNTVSEPIIVPATGHSFGDWYTAVEPTCTVEGQERRDCQNENCDHYETNVITALGHNYSSVVTAPTCTDKGYTTHTCSACGDSYIDDEVAATGDHNYVDCVCTVCGMIGGICGDNLFWTLDDGVLTIFGTGEMYNYGSIPSGTNLAPWNAYREQVTDIVIGEEVTYLGNFAFVQFTALAEVTIPDNVTSLGTNLFRDCTALTAVDFGSGVTAVSNYMFYGCTALETLDIPAHITSLGVQAFRGCGLVEFTIPDTVTSIGESLLQGCRSLKKVTVGNGINSLSNYMFNFCQSLTDVTLPEGLTSLGAHTFYHCDALTSFIVPEVETIGDFTFAYCVNLAEVRIPDSVNTIGKYAFTDCTSLATVIFEGDAPSIATNAFDSVEATCYYPVKDDTWTEDVMLDYGGTLTWIVNCDHSNVVTDEAKDPTCADTGLTEGKHCGDCGTVLVAQEVISANGHTWIDADCDTPKTCSVCGATEGEALGHEMGEWVTTTEPTCTEDGEKRQDCSRCDHYVTEVIVHSGHYEEVIPGKAPTCTEAGLTDGIKCSVCGEVLVAQEIVDALGHKHEGVVTTEPGCETTGVKTFTCSCGDTYTEEIAATGHTYVDGVCDNCGEAEPVEKFKLAGANMALGNTLTMNFFIYKTDVSDTDFYAVITHYNADGTIANELTLPYAQWDVRSTYFAISLPLFARQMADKIEVVVYNGKDVAVSETWTDSVRDYVMRNIDKSSFAAARTVMVDMLNYGAAAQINRKYNTTDLANNQLTEAHQAYATANVTAQNKLVAGTNYYGSSLTMKENLILTIYFKNITSDMYAVVEYTDYHGDHYKYEVAGTDFASVGSYKGVVINDLLVADGDVLVNVIIYDASGNEVASASDSMNSYAVRQIEKASDDAIYEMIAKFTASAKAYLGG